MVSSAFPRLHGTKRPCSLVAQHLGSTMLSQAALNWPQTLHHTRMPVAPVLDLSYTHTYTYQSVSYSIVHPGASLASWLSLIFPSEMHDISLTW